MASDSEQQDAGEDSSSDEERSGMHLPSLLKQLQTILREYPDGGQIIKEIIQNANDADATEMKICFESREIPPDPALSWSKYFVAPALCFYNNGMFNKKDWEGICTLYGSIKEEDKLKVGRFGLGFKSVFHISDYPSIISGDRLLVIDPLQENPSDVCWKKKLKKTTEKGLSAVLGKFGLTDQSLKTGKFKGTLFWLPLRRVPSKLSNNIYNETKVKELLDSFQTEAPITLLFLKSLQKIEWHDGSKMLFSVQVKDIDGQNESGKYKLQEETEKVSDRDMINEMQISIEIKSLLGGSSKKKVQKWLVWSLMEGKDEQSEEMAALLEDKSLSYPPYVSIAVPLNIDMSEFKGHVFCFLPLPVESKSLTGLPIHVNGFFSLSQNRRHVKWSSGDEKKNTPILWNECLLTEVVAKLYNIVIQTLIELSVQRNNTQDSVSLVYKCIPDETCVVENWNLILEPLYSAIVKEKFLYTPHLKGRSCWVDHMNCILPPDKSVEEVTWNVLRMVYLKAGENLVEVPQHIQAILKQYVDVQGSTVAVVSPDHLCKVLQKPVLDYQSLSVCEKLCILDFLVSDGLYDRLEGLNLLPLNNREFLTFENTDLSNSFEYDVNDYVFFCNADEIGMFPGLDQEFCMINFPDDIPVSLVEKVNNHLRNIANQEKFQVKQLENTDASKLIELAIEANCTEHMETELSNNTVWCSKEGSLINASWIDSVWNYLNEHFEDLQPLEDCPLLPYQIDQQSKEIRLCRLSETMILKETRGTESLPNMLCEALQLLGVLVLPSLRESVLGHPGLLDQFVKSPSSHGVLEVLSECTEEDINNFNDKSSKQQKIALLTYLHSLTMLPKTAIGTLRKLKLFSSTEHPGSERVFKSVEECNDVAPEQSPSVKFPKCLLYLEVSADRQFASLLGCETVTVEKLVKENLQMIQLHDQNHYSPQDLSEFMMYFLANIEHFQDSQETMELAKTVRFLCDNTCTAGDLYDPEDPLLKELFLQETRFPTSPFNSQISLRGLRKIGLRNSNSKNQYPIHVEDVLETAEWLDQSAENGEQQGRKSKALIAVLEKFPHFLQDSKTRNRFRNLKWITADTKTVGFPELLPWHESTELFRPSDVCSHDYSHVVGSVMPVVSTSTAVIERFGWEQLPPITKVLEQLDLISRMYKSCNKHELFKTICLIYKHLSGRVMEISNKNKTDLNQSNCIWTGDGFCRPCFIYSRQKSTDIDLKPYLYPVPEELVECSAFLRTLDCHESQTIDALLTVQNSVRNRSESVCPEWNPQRDLQMVVQILNRLKENSSQLSDDQTILFPVCTPDASVLVLKPADECTYCDNSGLKDLIEEEVDSIALVHQDVPTSTAEALGVKSLMQNLFSDSEGIQEWGQQEPLTTRLHSLLEGYSDGVSVLKEIVQNADDAGATKVCFLYDERENEQYRSGLMDEAMAECQGPALWAYNDAEFSDGDFDSITKLSGATKKMDCAKIGKFGLGFSAVYNLTDVPSIVSRRNVVIFDPHMKYLGKLIAGKQPGLKIDLSTMKNKVMLRKMRNQFSPYCGVFGCDVMTVEENSNFSGTLFRFPLRTENQASKINKTVYSKQEMKKLLKMFMESAANLLLFTQYVGSIEFYHLNADSNDPKDAVLMYETRREVEQKIPQSMYHSTDGNSITQHTATLLRNCASTSGNIDFRMSHKLRILITIAAETDLSQLEPGSFESYWIISWAMGTAQSLDMALELRTSFLPLASVAVPVQYDKSFLPCQLADTPVGFYKDGHVFCFLPLPIKTSLPVHINGCFALSSDRRQLSLQTEDDKECVRYKWNQALLGDAVPKAYLHLIETLRDIGMPEEYTYHKVWPTHCDKNFISIPEHFFTTITKNNLEVFCKKCLWKPLSSCVFFDVDPDCYEVRDIALSSLTKINSEKGVIILDIPATVNDRFSEFGCGQKIQKKTVTLEAFFEKFFLPKISEDLWSTDERNKLLIFAIDNEHVRHVLTQHICIPCGPKFRRIDELIDPNSSLASLFDEDDCRFPPGHVGEEKLFRKPSRMMILKSLGMMEKSIPDDLVIELAQSIEKLAHTDNDRALKKLTALLNYLGNGDNLDVWQRLQDIRFLPAMAKPSSWPLCWKANGTVWTSPRSLFYSDAKYIVGSQNLIVDDLSLAMSDKMKTELFQNIGIRDISEIKEDDVLTHIKVVCHVRCDELELEEEKTLREICNKIYKYLVNSTPKPALKSSLPNIKCVWTERGFRLPRMVVISQGPSDIDLSPHLCCLPHELKEFSSFFKEIGCQPYQNSNSLLEVMKRIGQIHSVDEFQEEGNVERDLRIIIQVLNKLKGNMDEIDHEAILFPTTLSTDCKLVLKPSKECSYCDAGWLKDLEDDENSSIIHFDVPNSTAEALGAQSMTQSLLSDTEGIEEWGQNEPLTTRLHSLLEGYSDGFSVPKEIIQNADDAGAKEVCFLFDERENDENKTCLIDKAMAECQGPALWVYNDAVFSESDFENITKLNGATKEADSTKIGKFGLGFSAVYNLTDVPSILSKNTVVIFDPHMKYLGKVVQGRQPGIKINLDSVQNKKMMKMMLNQFEPYRNVFGCDITGAPFPGTLFRFPLRTEHQAKESEISKLPYNRGEVKKLLEKFMESAGNLLLFSQHVDTIKLYHLPASERNPHNALPLMEVRRTEIDKVHRHIGIASRFDKNWTPLEIASDVVKRAVPEERPQAKLCSHLKIVVKFHQTHMHNLTDFSLEDSESHWLISWATGTKESMELALEESQSGFIPFSSVAVFLRHEGDEMIPCDLTETPDCFYKKGHLFCFLPLPIRSYVPLHINGCFAVTSDRKRLDHLTEDDKKGKHSDWNEAIMADAVCNAYVFLLEILQEFGLSPNYQYHQLWPTEVTSKECEVLHKQLYCKITHKSPKVFNVGRNWQALNNCIFLDPDFRSLSHVGDIAYKCLLHFEQSENRIIADLRKDIFNSFKKADCKNEIQERIYSMEQFFEKVFFPNIASKYWNEDERNVLTLYVLDKSDEDSHLHKLLRNHQCIPCKPNGVMLYPQEVVNPKSKVAKLFGESDGRFPHSSDIDSQSFETPKRLLALTTLGMMEDSIPIKLLIDRAESVMILNQKDGGQAWDRCQSVVAYIDRIMDDETKEQVCDGLHHVQFLPVKQRPNCWPIEWEADKFIDRHNEQEKKHTFDSPSKLCVDSTQNLVGSNSLILDEFSKVGLYTLSKVSKLVGVATEDDLPLEKVLRQLIMISKVDFDHLEEKDKNTVDSITTAIYKHLEKICKNANQQTQVERNVDLSGDSQQTQVERDVDLSDDLNNVLQKKKEEFGNNPLSKNELQLACNLVISLAALVTTENPLPSQDIYVPDTSGILSSVKNLCRDDCEFHINTSRLRIVHNGIDHNTAKILGVPPRRQQHIAHHRRGLPFGQSEKLTSRLRGLLDAYPCGIEIMKELMQNADDAGASELCFIKDYQNYPCERIFDDRWKPLQGPALCVYNNSSFTEADLQGIQRLGEGSKREDPTKTGQYGVGFNAVYHITDVPSFLTKGKNVNGGETLCVLDPHLCYVPEATIESPGNQYVELEELRREYSDVFLCYSDKVFKNDSGTLFRFPLRNEEMAKNSEIKNDPITPAKVDDLIEDFKKEMMESLLFVNNITSIAVCNICNNELKEEYVVNSDLEDDSRHKRQEFFNHLKSITKKIKDKTLNAHDIQRKQVIYRVKICDNKGFSRDWCVVQQIGFDSSHGNVPKEVELAIQNSTLGLLPRGGIAFPLPEFTGNHIKKHANFVKIETKDVKASQKKSHVETTAIERGKAFCFLPLSETTGLPVHLNGHFSLDHESRRNLWHDDNPHCPRTLWNKHVIESVIVDCYISGLAHLKLVIFQENQPAPKDEIREIHDRLQVFHAYFPIHKEVDGAYWRNLTMCLYKQIEQSRIRFFPVIQKGHIELRCHQNKETDFTGRVEWVSLSAVDDNGFPAYFSNIQGDLDIKPTSHGTPSIQGSIVFEKQKLAEKRKQKVEKKKEADSIKQIMKILGMKLIETTMSIHDSIHDSKVPVHKLKPCDMRSFLKSFDKASSSDHCMLGAVDVPLHTTVFETTDRILEVLKYCNLDGKLLKDLHGLPLLVTEDGILSVFTTERKVYSCEFCHLVSSNESLRHRFLHQSMVKWSESLDCHCTAFKQLTVGEFAMMLPDLLESKFRSNTFIPWNTVEFPNRKWIESFWLFFVNSISKQSETETNKITDNLDLKELLDEDTLIEHLRSLPLYETYDSGLSSLPPHKTAIVVPIEIPHQGLDEWDRKSDVILLKEHSKLIQALKDLEFLHGDRRKTCKASDFFSPFEKIFELLLQKDQFPPQPFCDKEWKKFMVCIGMKTAKDISTNLLIQFAQQIKKEGSRLVSDTIKKKSRELVNQLFSSERIWEDPVALSSLADIDFLVPHPLEKGYTLIHKQLNCDQKLIRFSGSVCNKHETLVWTTHNILSSDDYPTENCKMLQERLDICVQPKLNEVIQHIQNVCDSLKVLLEKGKIKELRNINYIMTNFYKHLQENLENEQRKGNKIKERLEHTPIIFLKKDKCLVPAYQAVQNLLEEQEMKPYLVKAPNYYGKYFELFEHLGTEKYPTANNFARVLAALYDESHGNALHPNELKYLCTAVSDFFKCVKKTKLTVEKLYLPSEDERLVLSTDLIFPDNLSYKRRIGSQDKLTFCLEFDKLEMDIKDPLDEIEKIPEKYRPKMLSCITREELVRRSPDDKPNSRTTLLEDFLHTPEFFSGVLRLIQHLKHKKVGANTKSQEEDELAIWSSLQHIKIRCVSVLETRLVVLGDAVPASNAKIECYPDMSVSKVGQDHVLYVSQIEKYDLTQWITSVIPDLIRLLQHAVHKSLRECETILTLILANNIKNPKQIAEFLDKREIRQYNAIFDSKENLFPPLGTIVPPKFHYLLDNSFSEFSDGEYVALETFDGEIDGRSEDTEGLDVHYIYAQVIEKIETNNVSGRMAVLLQKYKIDIGRDGKLDVVAMNIYKFHRKKNSKSKELVPTESFPTPMSSLSQEDIEQKIKEILKGCWSLPIDQRKRIIKRLILEWHPDKNYGNEKFCNKIFQYIQNLISRLENGGSLDGDNTGTTGKTSHAYYDFGQNIFRNRNRSQNDASGGYSHRHRNRHRSRNYESHDFYHDYEEEPQPNPMESRRWLRQAKCDLDAAKSCLEVVNPCYNWVCYKCHQSSEKALKAAWFGRDSRKVPSGHHLPSIASGLGPDLERSAEKLENLIGDHDRMRYPCTQTLPKIPADIYTREMATKACERAQSIIEFVSRTDT
ncbi:hypothetical protein ScPMuIL_003308 [Solemya velum]